MTDTQASSEPRQGLVLTGGPVVGAIIGVALGAVLGGPYLGFSMGFTMGLVGAILYPAFV